MIAALLLTIALPQNIPLSVAARAGEAPYKTYCASCHAADLRGSVNAPALRGLGPAALDFWMSTGRMPAAVPWIEVGHRSERLPDATIAAITAYVTSRAPGGPPIPRISAGGDLERGRALYTEHCLHCHGADAGGASIGRNAFAPTLARATIVQVAEAVRTGPGEMPPFSAHQLDDRALVDVASYVVDRQTHAATRTVPAGTGGPVPEGFIGWLAAAALAIFAYAFSRENA